MSTKRLKLALGDSSNVEDINGTGYFTGIKTGVFASLDAPANTTVITAGTYYPIAGNFTNSPIQNFTAVATPAIRYDGTLTQYFEIDWHASLSGDANNITVNVGIKIDGVLDTRSVMPQFLKNLGQTYTLSGTVVVELAQNSTVQLVLTSDTNGDIITVENFTTSITEFFD